MALVELHTESHGHCKVDTNKIGTVTSVIVTMRPGALKKVDGSHYQTYASVLIIKPSDIPVLRAAQLTPPVALAWGTSHPSTGTVGDDLTFEWVGSASPFQVIVTDSADAEIDNKAPTSSPYTFATGAHPAGAYTVKVIDANADEITQAVTLAAAIIPITNLADTEAKAFETTSGDSIANFVEWTGHAQDTGEKIHSDFDVVIAPSSVAEMAWADPAYTVTIKSGQASGTKFTITMTQKDNSSNVIVAHGKVK